MNSWVREQWGKEFYVSSQYAKPQGRWGIWIVFNGQGPEKRIPELTYMDTITNDLPVTLKGNFFSEVHVSQN